MKTRILLLIVSAVLVAGCSPDNEEGVSVVIGPTAIPRGNAIGTNDVTVNNGLFAMSFAVDTAPPWGVARGGILDVGIVRDGEIGYDFVSLIDFMPNRWSPWPTTYQDVSVERESPDSVVVRVKRDWGDVDLDTRFTIRANESQVHVITTMTNGGDQSLLDLLSGYIAWPDGGSLYGVPGLQGAIEQAEDARVGTGEAGKVADWSAMFDQGWTIGLHAPYSEHLAYGGRDRYDRHDIGAGGDATIEAWVQIEPSGSLAPIVEAEIERAALTHGKVSGTVHDLNGTPIETPAVVFHRGDVEYAFVVGDDGDYAMTLPGGTYRAYATAPNHGRSELQSVTVTHGDDIELDFRDVAGPATVAFAVSDRQYGGMVDARITIVDGPQQTVGYFGKNTLFTELDERGFLRQEIAPGEYTFAVSSAGGFTADVRQTRATLRPGQEHQLDVQIERLTQPYTGGWYSADLHHHSDVLDGFTEPEYVLRSQLAAGLDVIFLSDHDSVVNNAELERLAAAQDMPFIPAVELSPSWAHFNAFPVDDGKDIEIDTGQSTVQEIFAEARRIGADAIGLNHPHSDYGYFTAESDAAIPGGFDPGFDLVEIETGVDERNAKTLQRTWALWNDDRRVALVGGSDAHDVWLQESGSTRTYAWVKNEFSVDKFVAAVKAGRSYVSEGPLIFYPNVMFGSDIHSQSGADVVFRFEGFSVHGVVSATLVERGIVGEEQRLDFVGNSRGGTFEFLVKPKNDTWYSFIVEDLEGKRAYSNPIWVTIEDTP
ncbi:MAG: CehA/McbA family metallohydrolase [Pseudomonadota bacterium]